VNIKASMELRIVDSAIDPDHPHDAQACHEHVVRYRKIDGGKFSYRVFVWLDGPDLPFVDRVRWELHESFPQRHVEVARSFANQRCKLTLWTWGLFEIRAKVILKDRRELELTHMLAYDREFSDPTLKFELG
jgi:hypothetical protein